MSMEASTSPLERPLAEIIGGWYRNSLWGWHRLPCNGDDYFRCACQCNIVEGPTIDDMLAWLRDQERFTALVVIADGEVTVEVVLGDTTRFGAFRKAPTIRAALEAAVRAVAAERGNS